MYATAATGTDMLFDEEPTHVERIDIRRWALLGARERLAQLAAEATDIYKTFPELRSYAIGFGKRTRHDTMDAAGGAAPRRPLSAEARKRISDAQKARWARYRKSRPK